ncbi:MAG: ribosome biogenesis GTP-binding protein YihA/YsxC [Acidobacteriota bacterium]
MVFCGRSNVGKSSLINALVGQHRLARVSRTPGRTRQINFFSVTRMGTFVDLPGYGYARVPDAVRASWKSLVDGYLAADRPVAILLLLVDARHAPTRQDDQMLRWTENAGLPARVVLTKADAVPRSRLRSTVHSAARTLGLEGTGSLPIPVSSRTGQGIEDLRAMIYRTVNR